MNFASRPAQPQASPKPRLRNDLLLATLVFVLWGAQWLTTLAFKEQLYLEDGGESLRSPYWWMQHTVLNGIASNIGYYATIATAYRVFGYSIYMAKWVRLGLQLFSLGAVALILRRWMGSRKALLPLALAGLSPTWLYFNANQTGIGIDLQYLPLLLLLAMKIEDLSGWKQLLSAVALGAGWMWACLSYPTSIFFFPSLAMLLAWRLERRGMARPDWLRLGTLAAAGAALPIAAALLYVKAPHLLIYDPYVKAGILRGGGGGFTRRIGAIAEHFLVVWRDLFVESNSYANSLPFVEFGNWPARIGVAAIFAAALLLLRNKREQLRHWKVAWCGRETALLLWLFGSLLFIFCFPQLVATFPGLRRIDSVLIPWYGLTAFVWAEERSDRVIRWLAAAGCALLLLGHLLSLPQNLRVGRERRSGVNWFKEKPTLEESLDYWEDFTRNGGVLRCDTFEDVACRYQEIYPAIQGLRYWNHLPPHEVLGWDPQRKKVRPIELSIWETNEWPRW